MKLFRKREPVEDRNLSVDSLPPAMVTPTVAAVEVNGRTALALADVFGCVRALSDGAVLCPIECYRDTENGRIPLTGGRGPGLLRNPQPGVPQSHLVARLMQHCALWGECFIGKVRDADGMLIQLEALSPDRVVVQINQGEPQFSYYAPLGPVFTGLTINDVVHVKGMTAPDGIRGASPIGQCREAMGLATSLTVAASALWANGALPAGVLSVPPGTMAEDAIGNLAQAWGARHQGPEASGRIAVVSGDVQFSAVSMPLADAQFVDTRKLSTAEIARIFRVPTSVIGASSGDSLTYKTSEGEAQTFVTFGLGPWLKLIEDAISADRELLPGESTGCRFNMDELLRADLATRAAVYTQALGVGWMTVDEVRAREGLPPLPPDTQPNPAAMQFASAFSRTGVEADA